VGLIQFLQEIKKLVFQGPFIDPLFYVVVTLACDRMRIVHGSIPVWGRTSNHPDPSPPAPIHPVSTKNYSDQETLKRHLPNQSTIVVFRIMIQSPRPPEPFVPPGSDATRQTEWLGWRALGGAKHRRVTG